MANRFDRRVARGTPLGEALRRYWVPVCTSEEVGSPDCDPYRARILGEHLVVFRDSNGQVGVLDEACPHRKASLAMGRNEQGGLRCLWHQWKFGVDGRILDMPNASDCGFQDRVRAQAYPVRDSGGLVWAYLGPKEFEPPFPIYQWANAGEGEMRIVPVDLDCSFLYALEGLIDSSHVSLLHENSIRILAETQNSDKAALSNNTAPRIEVELTDFGLHYAALRDYDSDTQANLQARITTWVAPYLVFIASGNMHLSVPQDDDHCRFYNIVIDHGLAESGALTSNFMRLLGLSEEQLGAGGIATRMVDWRKLGDRNVFRQDRDAMRAGDATGVPGLTVEDAIMTVTAAHAPEWAPENFVPADIAIVRMRRWMNDQAERVARGEQPLATHPQTDTRKISGLSTVLEPGADWRNAVPDHLRLAE